MTLGRSQILHHSAKRRDAYIKEDIIGRMEQIFKSLKLLKLDNNHVNRWQNMQKEILPTNGWPHRFSKFDQKIIVWIEPLNRLHNVDWNKKRGSLVSIPLQQKHNHRGRFDKAITNYPFASKSAAKQWPFLCGLKVTWPNNHRKSSGTLWS